MNEIAFSQWKELCAGPAWIIVLIPLLWMLGVIAGCFIGSIAEVFMGTDKANKVAVITAFIPTVIFWLLVFQGSKLAEVPERSVVYNERTQSAKYYQTRRLIHKKDLVGCKVIGTEWTWVYVAQPILVYSDGYSLYCIVTIEPKKIPHEKNIVRWKQQANNDDTWGLVRDRVQQHLYDLDKSVELFEGFNNPYDPKQQESFRKLILPGVEKVLPSWLEVRIIGFTFGIQSDARYL